MKALRNAQETGSEIPKPEAICLRVVLEESMTREPSPINEAIINGELGAAVDFELHTENTDFARFDCRKAGCTATCSVVSTDLVPVASPYIHPGTQWLDGCISPED